MSAGGCEDDMMSGDTYINGSEYHRLEGLYEDIRELLDESALESEWIEIGRSGEDNPIYAACLGDGDFRKPELLFLSGVHPMEFIGPRMSFEVLREAAGRGKDSHIGQMLTQMNVWFLPSLNPDGYIRVQRQLASPPGIVYHRKNARGVDLNRNFPTAFYKHAYTAKPFAGSMFPFSPYHRGKEPCSEPESRAFRDFVFGRNFKMTIDLHSFGNVLMYPYGYTDKKCRDEDTFRIIGREIIKRQKPLKYRLIQASKHYEISGDICDWLYDEFRILAFCMELGGLGADVSNPKTVINPFYWANPVSPHGIVENNLDALLYLFDVLYEMFAL